MQSKNTFILSDTDTHLEGVCMNFLRTEGGCQAIEKYGSKSSLEKCGHCEASAEILYFICAHGFPACNTMVEKTQKRSLAVQKESLLRKILRDPRGHTTSTTRTQQRTFTFNHGFSTACTHSTRISSKMRASARVGWRRGELRFVNLDTGLKNHKSSDPMRFSTFCSVWERSFRAQEWLLQ